MFTLKRMEPFLTAELETEGQFHFSVAHPSASSTAGCCDDSGLSHASNLTSNAGRYELRLYLRAENSGLLSKSSALRKSALAFSFRPLAAHASPRFE